MWVNCRYYGKQKHIEKMLEHVSMERSGISLATHIKF